MEYQDIIKYSIITYNYISYLRLDERSTIVRLIEKYNADGGPTCWHHLVRSVTLMASDPEVGILEKLRCFKKNGNNIEVR